MIAHIFLFARGRARSVDVQRSINAEITASFADDESIPIARSLARSVHTPLEGSNTSFFIFCMVFINFSVLVFF